MDNRNIHDGLKDKEIRDFLSKKFMEEGKACSWNRDIDYMKKQIKEFQEMLDHAIAMYAVILLIKNNGWKNFDISDFICYDEEKYVPFIGTEKEFEELKKKIGEKK